MKTKKTNGCRPEETGGQMVAKVLLKKARGLQEGQKEKARRARRAREKARRDLKEGQTQKRKAKRERGKARRGLKKNRRERQEGKGNKKGPERRPVFEPEHWAGRPEWDPFWQEGRGKRSREARKAERSQRPDVQERRERGLQEGYPPNQVQPLQPGSQKWRLIKERERDLAAVEREVLADRARLAEERAAFLELQQKFLEERLGGPQPAVVLTPASVAAGPAVVLKEGPCGEMPEKRPDEPSPDVERPEKRPDESLQEESEA